MGLSPSHNYISIHAPRGGSDYSKWADQYERAIFQSTLPVGGATSRERCAKYGPHYFNPRSPWGERLSGQRRWPARGGISIHAPRGGSDGISPKGQRRRETFQSTLPVGGATR